MKLSDSSRAPAPIASIPITEPTPNTIPSAVSTVRVFCARRLSNASGMSERNRNRPMCVGVDADSVRQRLRRRPRPLLLFPLVLAAIGIRQRYHSSFGDAGDDHLAFAAPHQ